MKKIKAKFTNEAIGKDIDETIDDMPVDMDIIKRQADKEYTVWFYDYKPTKRNFPASEWKTKFLKKLHDQDIFFNRLTRKAYRFKSGVWNPVTEQMILKALEIAIAK
ncbi:hypothetical protein [Bacteroides uniformis]|jgi:hypothetical protein|uniref:Uncharacterized protein n=1 Tax=Bacteroides uniformis TaxID=820 RepID=A0A3E4R297_BACUN|nr:hypothetical protein [Bacteroides uniformis]RGL13340.1 hypothetical protein DXC80_10300 [Bacteroides uniformis]DAE79954.1 MAG TPA: hypothetical protein [Caudoviricetes sp.]DAE79997.1 MAG TPA: hypothetical protein [Caudoviricetes sp.]